jgi:hypothetical protein
MRPEHDLLVKACLLALLVAALTMLTLAVLRRHTWLLPPVRILHRLTTSTTAPQRPPSLLALSISRT